MLVFGELLKKLFFFSFSFKFFSLFSKVVKLEFIVVNWMIFFVIFLIISSLIKDIDMMIKVSG